MVPIDVNRYSSRRTEEPRGDMLRDIKATAQDVETSLIAARSFSLS
jgi:hypothetical protein